MWEELYKRYYPELLRFGMHACGSREAAEDIAQETFLRALRNADTLEELGASQRRAWLYSTFKNTLCDIYRRSQRENLYADAARNDGFYMEPGLERTENELVLRILSPEDRAIFTLRYLEDYTASEIAEMLNIPPATVRTRLSRCRKALKKELRDL